MACAAWAAWKYVPAWLGADLASRSAASRIDLTKEETIDKWFRMRTREAYRVKIVGEREGGRKLVVRYCEKDRILGYVKHEAVFSFDESGWLYGVQGDEPVHIPRGVAAR